MNQKFKTSRQRINELKSYCDLEGLSYEIKSSVSLAPDMSYAFAKAEVSLANGCAAQAHKLFYRKPTVDGIEDSSFAAGAETIAIARAIALLLQDGSEVAVQEEFDELVVFTTKRVNELYQISTRGAKDYVNNIQNDDLRVKASIYLESLLTKTAMQNANK